MRLHKCGLGKSFSVQQLAAERGLEIPCPLSARANAYSLIANTTELGSRDSHAALARPRAAASGVCNTGVAAAPHSRCGLLKNACRGLVNYLHDAIDSVLRLQPAAPTSSSCITRVCISMQQFLYSITSLHALVLCRTSKGPPC